MSGLKLVSTNDIIKNCYVNQGFNESRHSFVFSDRVHPDCSEKYVQIQTGTILEEVRKQMGDFEWEVLRQGKSRRGLSDTKAHIVAVYFTPIDHELKSYGKFALYIINSSDRTKKLKMSYGWLNGACLNGCIFGELVLETLEQRHMGDLAKNIPLRVSEIVHKIKEIVSSGMVGELELIKQMMRNRISVSEFKEFAQKAIELRIQKYSNLKTLDASKGENYSFDPMELEKIMSSARGEFKEITLWNAYQILHENLGGNFENLPSRESKKVDLPKLNLIVSRVKDNEIKTRNATLRKFNDIDQKVNFNQDLIELMSPVKTTQLMAA